jgi:microcystin-dependent protein
MHDANYASVTATPAYDASKNLVDFTTKKYLGISINGGVEMFPRSQLVPSFHAYTANHADHATQADNADNLGGKAASTYAQLNHVNTSDDTLDQRITDEVATLNGQNNSLGSRTTTLESRFTGLKANDADKLDGLNYNAFMRNTSANGYYGMHIASGTSDWVRTTTNGLLPFNSGGASSLGTSSWPFSKLYANDIYDGGTLLENKFLGKSAKAVNADKLDNLNSTDFLRSSHITDLVPVGTILIWPTSNLPAGYRECNGNTLSKASYPELYSVIGNTYGGGSTTFAVPDYRGLFLRGWAHGSGHDPDRASRTGGDIVGSYQADNIKSHRHVVKSSGDAGAGGGLARGDSKRNGTEYSEYVGGTETRPKNKAVMYIIKYRSY